MKKKAIKNSSTLPQTKIHSVVENQLVEFFFHHPKIKSALPDIEEAVINGNLPATAGAQKLLELILSDNNSINE